MSLREDQRVIGFVGEVEKLRALLETDPIEISAWIQSVFRTLAALYSLGLNLPDVEDEFETEEFLRLLKEFKVTTAEVGAVSCRVGRIFGRHDVYHDVYDPTDANDHCVVEGRLNDDLSDIHAGIVSGLRIWKANGEEKFATLAVCYWHEGFKHNWGLRATETMRALHYLVEDRELNAFSAGTD